MELALLRLRAITGQEGRQNHVLDNIQHPGSEERHTMLFLECRAQANYELLYRNKRGILSRNIDHLTYKG